MLIPRLVRLQHYSRMQKNKNVDIRLPMKTMKKRNPSAAQPPDAGRMGKRRKRYRTVPTYEKAMRASDGSSDVRSRPRTARGCSTSSTVTHSNNSCPTSSASPTRVHVAFTTNQMSATGASSEEPGTTRLFNLRRPKRRQSVFPILENDETDEYLNKLAETYSISSELVERLRLLEDYEIVILCDDSGSMKMRSPTTGKTRWEELKEIVKVILHIGTVFDSNGVDVYFLNRPTRLNVTDPAVIDEAFAKQPSGYSHLARALKHIFSLEAAKPENEKQLLVFVATDAEPTNEHDKRDLACLEDVMVKNRNSSTTYVMFLLCSDKRECYEYMSEWDRRMENVDVIVDFERQKELVRKSHGADHPFSFGDYIVKALLGAIDPEMDALGEHA